MAAALGWTPGTASTSCRARLASWAGVRDKLLGGELDMAHALYGMVYGVQLGIGGPQQDMAVLMTLNRNGQGLTLSRQLADRGATDLSSLARLMASRPRSYTLRADLSDRHACDVAVLLAGRRPASTRCAMPARSPCRRRRWWRTCGWADRRLLRRRAVEPARHRRRCRCHRGHLAGRLARASGKGAGLHRAIRRPAPGHGAGRGHGGAGSQPLDRRQRRATRRIAADALARADVLDMPVQAIAPRLLGHYDNGRGRVLGRPARR